MKNRFYIWAVIMLVLMALASQADACINLSSRDEKVCKTTVGKTEYCYHVIKSKSEIGHVGYAQAQSFKIDCKDYDEQQKINTEEFEKYCIKLKLTEQEKQWCTYKYQGYKVINPEYKEK